MDMDEGFAAPSPARTTRHPRVRAVVVGMEIR
jgi:hypothetical protein